MDFWHWGGFFKSVKGHVIKWWQQVVLPVFRINNNGSQNTPNQTREVQNTAQETVKEQIEGKENINDTQTEAAGSKDTGSGSRSNVGVDDILKRLEGEKREEEEKKHKEIENVRRQRQEQEKIDAIMNANKVNVNAFIEEGRANRENRPEENDRQQEDMQRVQEIMDRLNREAAEDEAKKRAEIEAAREKAEEKFG